MKKLTNLRTGILAIGLAISATCQVQNGLMVTTVVDFDTPSGVSQLVQGSDGALYGGLSGGGPNALGTIFKLTLGGSLTTLASFNGTNGAGPGMPILAPDGYFYGATYGGGSNYDGTAANEGYGTVYRMDSNGVLTTLFLFDQTNGWYPRRFLLANDGSFYGTTDNGGNGDGTLFRITTNGCFTSLVSFNGTDGSGPTWLLQASDGNFYGTTGWGGTNGLGTLFKMTPDGQLTNLAVFNGANGWLPECLIQASDGCLYGTTAQGGVTNSQTGFNGGGVIFKVTTNGDFNVLVMFNGTNGAGPTALTEISNGVFYCTTEIGGENYQGALFEVTTNGALTQLLPFGPSPQFPSEVVYPLTKASDGNYYGSSIGFYPDVFCIRPIQAPVLQPGAQGSQFNLSWNAWAGYSYNVMYETNLNCTNWTLLSTITPQTNGLASYSDNLGPDAQRFYTVVLQLP